MKLLRAIVEGPYEPNDINVLWIDTSLDGVPVLRKYANGFWTYVSSSGTAFIVEVDTLPEASKQTLGKMYATPSQNPQPGDTTDEWLTVVTYDNEGNASYTWEQIGQNPDISQFITKSVDNLDNYYLKTETFTQQEITDRINASKNLVYLVVDELPQASSSTLNSIYLLEDDQQENVYDMYITQYDESTTTYSWLNIGNTSIDLSLYATEAELATLQAEVDDVEDAVEELDEKKANKNGSYEQMSVGIAKNLEGKTLVSDAFFERTTGGSAELANGIAQLKEVKGHSVAWNQLVKNGDFSNSTTDWVASLNTTFSVSDGVASIIPGAQYQGIQQNLVGIVSSHKYLVSGLLYQESAAGAYIKGSILGTNVILAITDTSVWKNISGIYTAGTSSSASIGVGSTYSSGWSEIKAKNIFIIDLTLLGIDNLTTVAQVEAWLADNVGLQSYYPYTAGTILNNKLAGIESYGFNLLDPSTGKARIIGAYSDTYGNYYGITGTHGDITFVDYLGNSSTITPDTDGKFQLTVPGELTVASAGADCAVFFWWDGTKTEYEAYDKKTEYLDVTHIYGKLNGEGNLVQVFPSGMLYNGVTRDSLVTKDGMTVAKKNCISIAMVNATVSYSTSYTVPYFQIVFGNEIRPFFYICGRPYSTQIKDLSQFRTDDGAAEAKIFYPRRTANSTTLLYKDSSLTSTEQFNTNMANVYCNFALNTPEIYTNLVYQGSSYFADGTPVTLPVNYQVNNWGMERLLPQNTTESVTVIAPEVSMLYSIDAVEQLDTHTTQIEELTTTVTGLGTDKADKDTDAVVDNIAVFDASGNPVDKGFPSGQLKKAYDDTKSYFRIQATGTQLKDYRTFYNNTNIKNEESGTCKVDWGDGTPEVSIVNDDSLKHAFPAAGVYEIKITGLTGIIDNLFLKEVTWLKWARFGNTFTNYGDTYFFLSGTYVDEVEFVGKVAYPINSTSMNYTTKIVVPADSVFDYVDKWKFSTSSSIINYGIIRKIVPSSDTGYYFIDECFTVGSIGNDYYDVSANSQGASYATFQLAVAAIPNAAQVGFMKICFLNSISKKRELYVLENSSFTTSITYWKFVGYIDSAGNGDFQNLGDALTEVSVKYPVYKYNGNRIVVTILDGAPITDQVLVNGLDLSWITIEYDSYYPAKLSYDTVALAIANGTTVFDTTPGFAAVAVNASGFSGSSHDTRDDVCLFRAEDGGRLPIINCVFKLVTAHSSKGVAGIVCNRGSEAVVKSLCGFIGFQDGVISNNESSITIREGITLNCGRWGVHARHNGEVSARSLIATGCATNTTYSSEYGCAVADRVAALDVREAYLGGNVAIKGLNASHVCARAAHVISGGVSNDYLVKAAYSGIINASDMTFANITGSMFEVINGGMMDVFSVTSKTYNVSVLNAPDSTNGIIWG